MLTEIEEGTYETSRSHSDARYLHAIQYCTPAEFHYPRGIRPATREIYHYQPASPPQGTSYNEANRVQVPLQDRPHTQAPPHPQALLSAPWQADVSESDGRRRSA